MTAPTRAVPHAQFNAHGVYSLNDHWTTHFNQYCYEISGKQRVFELATLECQAGTILAYLVKKSDEKVNSYSPEEFAREFIVIDKATALAKCQADALERGFPTTNLSTPKPTLK